MLNSISEAVEDIRGGKMVVVVDDETRENEGDLIMAAAKATPDSVNFMAREGRGLICVPFTSEYASKLKLEPMVKKNTERMCTNFTVSVDYAKGTTTGISMADRALTINALSNPDSVPEDFLKPGHVFPLIADEGGVIKRSGHTEAAVDLVRMAGFPPVGVLCEIIRDDGKMARISDLLVFASKHNLKIISISDLKTFIEDLKK